MRKQLGTTVRLEEIIKTYNSEAKQKYKKISRTNRMLEKKGNLKKNVRVYTVDNQQCRKKKIK